MTRGALAEECVQVVMETVPPVMRVIREEIRRHGTPLFTIPQIRTLAFLHHQPGACLFELAEHLGVTRPTASSLVERLVRRDLVIRTPDPRERRRVLLTLTPLGLRHFRSVQDSARQWMATILDHMSPATLRRIIAGITLLREGLLGSPCPRHPQRAMPRLVSPARPGTSAIAVTLAARKEGSHA